MIRLLIIDDSPTMRAILASRLADEDDIRIAGMAESAEAGRIMIRELDPDVVTLDVEMPGMNGLDFLEKVMKLRPTPVIVVSGRTQEGTAETARALALGAVDCYAKSDRWGNCGRDDNGKLAAMVRRAAQVRYGRARKPAPQTRAPFERGILQASRVIGIGASTGGVETLHTILAGLSPTLPPIVIVQHVNAQFAPAIARSLDESAALKVKLAETGEKLLDGHAYLAPGGDRHLVVRGNSELHAHLLRGDPVNGHRPSIDVLFQSIAGHVGAEATGVILTGMGQDGAAGMQALAQKGAITIAQDKDSSIVFGMPRAAIECGAVQIIAPPDAIARHLRARLVLP